MVRSQFAVVVALVAAMGSSRAQEGMSSVRRLEDGDEIQGQSSEQRFLREPLDQVILFNLAILHNVVNLVEVTKNEATWRGFS